MTSALKTLKDPSSGASDSSAPRAVDTAVAIGRRPYLVAVPDCEPPFDDELPAAVRAALHRSAAAGGFAGTPVMDWTVPGWSRDADVGVQRTSAAALPDARQTAGVFARALIEALAGYRQLAQLNSHCSPEVFAGLRLRVRPGGPLPKLTSIRASEPTDGVAEATAVFRRGPRAAAIAFRLQGVDGRWRVTALQIG